MTQRTTPLFVLACVTSSLAAQDPAMPSPRLPQHERLAAFVGTWRAETELAAMPGVPGMEEATTMTGVEHASMLCNGLWLHVSGDGSNGTQSMSGLWMVGFNAYTEKYECLVASSAEEAPCCLEASFDEDTETWHFRGEMSGSVFRSEMVFESADRSIETAFAIDDAGGETQFMRTVRTRIDATAADASTDKPDAPASSDQPDHPAALTALLADCGTWDADFEMAMPGMPPMTSKCREIVRPILGGKWTWSTFTGEIMGGPFEGHALTGYDSKTGQVVSFWIDSMTGPAMRTDGTFDADTGTFSMTGHSYDENGRLSPVSSKTESDGKDARTMRMEFGTGEAQSVLTITYRRAER